MYLTKLETYEQQLYDQGIIVKESYVPKANAMCMKFKNGNFNSVIFYDPNKLNNDSKEIHCALLHEEMHLTHEETMYGIDEPIAKQMNKERKIKRLISRKCIPQETLFNMLYERHMELYEIADELCLTEDIIKDAYEYYSQLESWIKKKMKYDEDPQGYY